MIANWLQELESMGTFVALLSVLVAILTFAIGQRRMNQQDRARANREIYQRLELASINLFQFDAQKVDLSRPLWEKGVPMPEAGTAEFNAYMNYVCQALNLFEMAVRFRRDDVMPRDVFGSWVIWFYTVCSAPGFPPLWKEVRLNYICELRELLTVGVNIAKQHENDEDKGLDLFFEYVESKCGCTELTWYRSCGRSGKGLPKRCAACDVTRIVGSDQPIVTKIEAVNHA